MSTAANFNAAVAKAVTDTDLFHDFVHGSASDDIVTEGGTIPSLAKKLATIVTDRNFAGVWNVATNTPDVSATSPTTGDYYIVTVAGTSSITGSSENYVTGDQIVYDGTAWHKVVKPADQKSTRTVANAAAIASETPDFKGQLLINEDVVATDLLAAFYVSKSSTVGDWEQLDVGLDNLDAVTRNAVDKGARGTTKVTPRYNGSVPVSFGKFVDNIPEAAGWADDDLVVSADVDGVIFPDWVTGTFYSVGDFVQEGGSGYYCDVAHTAGTFATDKDTNGYWTRAYTGFPRACYIPQKRRLLVTFRLAKGHGYYDADIYVMRTDDFGANWRIEKLIDGAGDDYRTAPIKLLQDGRLMAVATRITGAVQTGAYDTFAYYSDDFGESWSAPQLVHDAAVSATGSCTSLIFQARNGDIYIPIYTAPDSSVPLDGRTAGYVKSTDNGASWSAYTEVTDEGPTYAASEITFVQATRSDDIIAFIRAENGTDKLFRSVSTDNGASWSATTDVTPSNYKASQPNILQREDGFLHMACRAFSGSGLGYYYSTDDGLTWTGPVTGYVGVGGDERSDILQPNVSAEGQLVAFNSHTTFCVFGNETGGGVGGREAQVVVRTWAHGVADTGPGRGGLRFKGGGFLDFDLWAPPIISEGDADASPHKKQGATLWSKECNCLVTWNGTFWEPQAPRVRPSETGVDVEMDLKVEGLAAGALATWVDDATAGVGNLTGTPGGSEAVVTKNAQRGRNALVFDGTQDYSTNSSTDFLVDDSVDYTILVPFYVPASAADPADTMALLGNANDNASGSKGLLMMLDDRQTGNSMTRGITIGIVNSFGWGVDLRDEQVGNLNGNYLQKLWEYDTWNVVALTYDKTNSLAKMYVNGNFIEDHNFGTFTRPSPVDADFHIGSLDGNLKFTGRMGSPIIMKTLLDAAEIRNWSNYLVR